MAVIKYDGTFYYVMEYLPGLSLNQRVRGQGVPSAALSVHILRQVCGALGEAHAIGLVHRDVKPGNIIVCERGGIANFAKLLDFGLVHRLEVDQGNGLAKGSVIAGSPEYMSPEQASGQESGDARSDICSLGAVAYLLLTLQR